MDDLDQLLEANEAVKYLAKRWEIESYSLEAFRMLRWRYNIKPALSSKTSTFWRKSDLDKIEKPDRSKKRKKSVDANGRSLMLMGDELAEVA
jgi:hypothetical protein